MKRSLSFRRGLAPLLVLALACTLISPASAFFWNRNPDVP